MNCAIALSLANDQAGLDKLANRYGAAMANMPEADTFRVLTQPEKEGGQLRDLAAAQSKLTDVNMFQGFLNAYRKAGALDATSDAKDALTQKGLTPVKAPGRFWGAMCRSA